MNLLYTLLSVIIFALLFPAIHIMINLMREFGPGISTDFSKGTLVFHDWLHESSVSFVQLIAGMPFFFWLFLLFVYFTKNKKANEWITATKGWKWLFKWQGTIWPIVFFCGYLWAVNLVETSWLDKVFFLVIFGALFGFGAFKSYCATKKGEQFWNKETKPELKPEIRHEKS